MLTVVLALRSLRNRLLTTGLTIASIALSVTLLVGVENVRVGMRESFSNTISQTDLIVGARGGSTQLLLSSVFGMGTPQGGVSWATYERVRSHPAVAWTIPYSLGDSHRGYRVIGTTDAFYERYRYRRDRGIGFARGRAPADDHEVVIGAEVAQRLGYTIGAEIELSHGVGPMSFVTHDSHPFEVVGILDRTFTPIDRSLYVTLEGIEAMHEGFDGGGARVIGFGPPPGGGPSAALPSFAAPTGEPDRTDHEIAAGPNVADPAPGVDAITSFFIGTGSRLDALQLQQEINTFAEEPLSAILPGVALAEMWRGVGYAEDALKIVTSFVVLVGLLGMIVSLYTSLNERRREMAILRAVGARRGRIISLLVLESGLLATLGCAVGVGLVYTLVFLARGPVEQAFGLYIPLRALGSTELTYIGAVVAAGFLLGLVPAIKAYRNALTDGLSVKV